ncbi:MAG: carboxypeptidase regulatory-like domain-containing protein [Pyrinomonadaceae bacterium]
MKKLSSFIVAITLLFFVASEMQASCDRIVQHPPCTEFWRADAVFIATAIEVETKPQIYEGVPPITARLKIEEVFKGGIKEKEFIFESNDCGFQFKQGEKYLVYAHRRNNKLNVQIGHTRTKLLAEATEDLNYLRSLQRDEPQAQIVGKVGQQTTEIKETRKEIFLDNEWLFIGLPMANIKVFAKGAEQTYETFSDAKGEYKFVGLPSGEYEIWADYALYFESKKVTVKTKTEGCGVGNIYASRKGAISGRVTDTDGAAVSDLRLSLVLADATREEILETRGNEVVWNLGMTDKKGEYRFPRLPAGRYYVVINRTDFERSLGNEQLQKIPRLFYPGVKNIEEATVISIEEGEQARKKDFRLPKSK